MKMQDRGHSELFTEYVSVFFKARKKTLLADKQKTKLKSK